MSEHTQWVGNVPVITKSNIRPCISEVRGVIYAQPGWIPIDKSVTVEQLLEHWTPPTIKTPKPIEFKTFNVPSSNGKKSYIVTVENGNWSCECQGYGWRGKCRHITSSKEN